MPERTTQSSQRVVTALCGFVATLALLVLVGGWLLDVARLRSFVLAWSPMAPLTAVLLLLASLGSSQFQRRPALSNSLLVLTFVLGSAVLIAYFTGARIGLERLSMLFHRSSEAALPELPAPDAAAAFILLAIALFLMRTGNKHVHDFADVVAVTIGIVCFQVLIEHTYNLAHFPGVTGFRQIAPHSTVAVILLAVSVVANRPSDGTFQVMVGGTQSALLLRRLLPIAAFSCLLVGLLAVEGARARIGTVPMIVSWSVTGAVVILTLLLFVTSAEMRKAEAIVRKREDELIAATAVAEAASNTKSRFMAVMSHELRTPLTAMLGYADLLDAGVAGELTLESRKFVERIRSSGWHLVGLIDAVLLYASGRPAGEQAREESFDLVQLVREVMEIFESQARDKRIALDVDAPVGRIGVRSEPSRLREILLNLIGNAVKFTERGSVVVRVRAGADSASVAIIDTGVGISEEHLAHLWEPFEQADEPHTRAHGGMGLGLALTRLLADQLDVRLNVASKVGQGTTVALELPRAGGGETRREDIQLKGRHVLVVDDDVAVRRIMARALARYGARILEARSGREAIEFLDADDSIDAVVTDISMPGMSGIELARILTERVTAPPILFVTGAELSAEDRAEIDALGGRLLNKPFEMPELARTVLNLV